MSEPTRPSGGHPIDEVVAAAESLLREEPDASDRLVRAIGVWCIEASTAMHWRDEDPDGSEIGVLASRLADDMTARGAASLLQNGWLAPHLTRGLRAALS